MKTGLQVIAVMMVMTSLCVAGSPAQACVVGTGTAGSCTQAALDACLPGSGSFDGSVTFLCGAAPHTIVINATKTISADTTINGGGLITIDGGSAVRVFSVDFPRTLTLQNLTIANGKTAAGDNGGAIENFGTVNATNCTFNENSTTGGGDGGAIDNDAGTLNLTNCTFSGNFTESGGSGGAIDNNGGTASVTGCTLDQNIAKSGGNGGAILNNGGKLDVAGSTFTGNMAQATGNGGAIYNDGGKVSVTTSTFTDNSAGDLGGGIYTTGGTLMVTQTTFDHNLATAGAGGGFYGNGGTLTLANSTFTRNNADDGGALYFDGTNITINNTTLSKNVAGDAGGGISSNGAKGFVTNTILATNTGGNCNGTISDGGHNIDDGTSCGFSMANGSLPMTDPALDPAGLADNGGLTQTIALCARPGMPSLCTVKSPAINAADNATCTSEPVNGVDQRGFLRFPPGDPVCDIGAFEANSFAVTPGVQAPALSPAPLIALMLALTAVGTRVFHRHRR